MDNKKKREQAKMAQNAQKTSALEVSALSIL